MPAQSTKTTPLFFLFPNISFFGNLKTEKKSSELTDVTKIDFPIIKDGKILTEELEEALTKLEEKTLNLVISDEIFHHYIADFPAKSDMSLEEHVSRTVGSAFPDEHEPLHIVTLDLAKTKKIQTVQISAITKDNLARLNVAAQKAGVAIKTIIPASFSVKAFVSIDPSLFILQTTDAFLLTSHYIGVEYAKRIDDNNLQELAKAIEALKKTHPHIQHAYICAEEYEVGKIEEAIKESIPTQPVIVPQVAAEEDTPYMIKVLALGYRDVIENKFPYPIFSLKNAPALSAETTKETSMPKTSTTAKTDDKSLPKPETIEPAKIEEVKTEEKEDTKTEVKPAEVSSTISAPKVEPIKSVSPVIAPVAPATSVTDTKPTTPVAPIVTPVTTTKEKKGGKNWGTYIIIALVVALVIALIGGGIIISQGALKDYGKGEPQKQEETQKTAEPTAEPTKVPEPTATPIAKKDLSVLVVNATKTAGLAGKTATKLTDAGYGKPDTGNAKGKYETGTFVMIKDEKQVALVDQFKTDLKLEKLEKVAYDETEDAKAEYDVVIILAE